MVTRGRTTELHGHGTLRLSGSVLSPYFQTILMREEAPDRDSNSSLDSMAKKVIVGAIIGPVTSETSFVCPLAGYDDGGGEILHETVLNVPLTNGSSTNELVDYVVSTAVTWANASPRSYGITAVDVVRPAAVIPFTALAFDNPARSLNSAFQISATRAASVNYSVDIATTVSLAGGAVGTVFLEYADDSGFTTNVKEVGRMVNGNTGTLVVGLTLNQTATAALSGIIPAAKYARLRTANTTGTPTFTFRSAQEVLLASN